MSRVFYGVLTTFYFCFSCGSEQTDMKDLRSQSPLSSGDVQKIDDGSLAAGCPEDFFLNRFNSSEIISKGKLPVAGNYEVKANSSLDLERSPAGVSINTAFKLKSVEPELARGEATKALTKLNGKRTVKLLETNWTDYFSASGHSHIKCGIYPAREVLSETSEGRSVVSFEPALPFLISPAMFDEIDENQVFANISAKIVESSSGDLKKGTSLKGQVTVKKLKDSRRAGDSGFEVLIDFGGSEQTTKLGLLPQTSYFFSDSKLFQIEAATGKPSPPLIVYTQNPS